MIGFSLGLTALRGGASGVETLTSDDWVAREAQPGDVNNPADLSLGWSTTDPETGVTRYSVDSHEEATRRSYVGLNVSPASGWQFGALLRSTFTTTPPDTQKPFILAFAGSPRAMISLGQTSASGTTYAWVARRPAGSTDVDDWEWVGGGAKAITVSGVPLAPLAVTLTGGTGQITATLPVAPGTNGRPLTSNLLELTVSTDTGFATPTLQTTLAGWGDSFVADLTPATYIARVRASNVNGAGAWSPTSGSAVVSSGTPDASIAIESFQIDGVSGEIDVFTGDAVHFYAGSPSGFGVATKDVELKGHHVWTFSGTSEADATIKDTAGSGENYLWDAIDRQPDAKIALGKYAGRGWGAATAHVYRTAGTHWCHLTSRANGITATSVVKVNVTDRVYANTIYCDASGDYADAGDFQAAAGSLGLSTGSGFTFTVSIADAIQAGRDATGATQILFLRGKTHIFRGDERNIIAPIERLGACGTGADPRFDVNKIDVAINSRNTLELDVTNSGDWKNSDTGSRALFSIQDVDRFQIEDLDFSTGGYDPANPSSLAIPQAAINAANTHFTNNPGLTNNQKADYLNDGANFTSLSLAGFDNRVGLGQYGDIYIRCIPFSLGRSASYVTFWNCKCSGWRQFYNDSTASFGALDDWRLAEVSASPRHNNASWQHVIANCEVLGWYNYGGYFDDTPQVCIIGTTMLQDVDVVRDDDDKSDNKIDPAGVDTFLNHADHGSIRCSRSYRSVLMQVMFSSFNSWAGNGFQPVARVSQSAGVDQSFWAVSNHFIGGTIAATPPNDYHAAYPGYGFCAAHNVWDQLGDSDGIIGVLTMPGAVFNNLVYQRPEARDLNSVANPRIIDNGDQNSWVRTADQSEEVEFYNNTIVLRLKGETSKTFSIAQQRVIGGGTSLKANYANSGTASGTANDSWDGGSAESGLVTGDFVVYEGATEATAVQVDPSRIDSIVRSGSTFNITWNDPPVAGTVLRVAKVPQTIDGGYYENPPPEVTGRTITVANNLLINDGAELAATAYTVAPDVGAITLANVEVADLAPLTSIAYAPQTGSSALAAATGSLVAEVDFFGDVRPSTVTARSIGAFEAETADPDWTPFTSDAQTVNYFGGEITYTVSAGQTGQYADGSYWSTGTVTDMAPALATNATRTLVDASEVTGTTVHGWRVDPGKAASGSTLAEKQSANGGTFQAQSYDSLVISTNAAYDATLRPALPITTRGSVVKVRSKLTDIRTDGRPVLDSAGVLTLVDSAPAAGSLRPPLADPSKTPRLNSADIDLSLLSNIDATGYAIPAYADALEWVTALHTWENTFNVGSRNIVAPNATDPGDVVYFGGMANLLSQVLLGMHFNAWTAEQKTTLAIRLGLWAQDIAARTYEGGVWQDNGGHAHGRLPVLAFCAELFDSQWLRDACAIVVEAADAIYTVGSPVYGDLTQLAYVTQTWIDLGTPEQDLTDGEAAPAWQQSQLGWPGWAGSASRRTTASTLYNILGHLSGRPAVDSPPAYQEAGYVHIVGKSLGAARLAVHMVGGDALVPQLWKDYADRYMGWWSFGADARYVSLPCDDNRPDVTNSPPEWVANAWLANVAEFTTAELWPGTSDAPSLSSLSGTATGETTADLSVTTDQRGPMWVVLTESATAPSATQIKAGQDHAGASAAFSDYALVTTTGAQAFSATGLTAATTYYLHAAQSNASADTTVATSASFETQSAVATFFSTVGTGPYFLDTANPPASTTRMEWEARIRLSSYQPTAGFSSYLFAQLSQGCDLEIVAGGDYSTASFRVIAEDGSGTAVLANTSTGATGVVVPALNTWFIVRLDVDMAAGTASLDIDGVEEWSTTFTPASGFEYFQTARKVGFLSRAANSLHMPAGTDVEYAEVYFTTNGVRSLRKRIEGNAATVNADSWKLGDDAT